MANACRFAAASLRVPTVGGTGLCGMLGFFSGCGMRLTCWIAEIAMTNPSKAGWMMMFACLLAMPAQAGEAHAHGIAGLGVAIEGQELTIEFDSLADNLLGFEHAPKSAAEQKRAGEVLALISKPEKLFRLNPEAKCSANMPAIEAPLLLGRPVSGEHSDIAATFGFRCAKPAALSRLDVLLFDVFPGMGQIKLQLAGPTGQRGQTLTKAQRSVSLK